MACAALEAFSTPLEWAMEAPLTFSVGFLFVGPSSPASGEHLSSLQTLAKELGIPLAPDKTEGPTTSLCYLGIQLDLVAALSAPMRTSCLTMMHPEGVTVLGGALGLCLSGGRTGGGGFLCSLAWAMAGAAVPHHRIRITKGTKEDLRVWLEFLSSYNGTLVWKKLLELNLF